MEISYSDTIGIIISFILLFAIIKMINISAISILIFSNYGIVILLHMLICLGVFQIFNVYFYEQDKKVDETIAILSSMFIFVL